MKNISKKKTRDCRVYAYITTDLGEWLQKMADKNKLAYSTAIYECIKYCKQNKFEPQKKCLKD